MKILRSKEILHRSRAGQAVPDSLGANRQPRFPADVGESGCTQCPRENDQATADPRTAHVGVGAAMLDSSPHGVRHSLTYSTTALRAIARPPGGISAFPHVDGKRTIFVLTVRSRGQQSGDQGPGSEEISVAK